MAKTRRIDFDEPIPMMIERLKSEHIFFEAKLVQIENSIGRNNIKQAAEKVEDMADKIIEHAVEEEARLMRVIMKNAKDESSDSIKIMQEHNWVMRFVNNRLMLIKNAATSSDPAEYEKAKGHLNEFVNNLRKHFKEEEQVVFPLTLRSHPAGYPG
jgi:hemerythrin-like domain-containing protein